MNHSLLTESNVNQLNETGEKNKTRVHLRSHIPPLQICQNSIIANWDSITPEDFWKDVLLLYRRAKLSIRPKG
jgi:hypothetical protein